ncbi:hypothetical protein KI387_027699 [Taxus chinensis]|uniref:non-specific serine/threonine protein kinase n=1 Tax=Taxus chinensis TaxID=29808 RepID=A0AA38L2G1_TAXCH|nr:hypothetical protein KI387_027699 [Taxus chinensis]
MQISSEELHRATEGFSPGNLLGAGSSGSVYRGLLPDNTLVAVKIVLTSCCTVDFRALVLEFMSKGSLEHHLHDDKRQGRLSLKTRLNIALDVAHGMAYLHHDCSSPVIHCDLKPSNVLMDETMTAHVSDFGIARLMMPADGASSSTSRPKGTVGYIAPGKIAINTEAQDYVEFLF